MKVALVLTPAWSREMPHLAIAILSSILKQEGHQVFNFDLNNFFYRKCKEEYKIKWSKEHDFSWTRNEFISEFILEHDQLINQTVTEILDTGAEVIGFSVYFPTELMSLELARKIKEADKNRIIVFGGPQCLRENNGRSLIEKKQVDAVVIGEGDLIFPELLKIAQGNDKFDFCRGTLLKNDQQIIDCGDRAPITNLDIFPFPDFTDFNIYEYERPYSIPVLFSRGCIQKCVYCSVNNFWKTYRSLNSGRMFKEIEHQLDNFKEVNRIDFYDPLINGDIKELYSFCSMVIKAIENKKIRPIQWRGEAIIRPEMTTELLCKMRQAGCCQLTYGIESGSQKVLNKMRKGYNVKYAQDVLRNTHEAGIYVSANFMFGFPTETRDDFLETMNFLKMNYKFIDEINPSESFCFIYKDTYLYNHAEEFGLTVDPDTRFWESTDAENNFLERMRRFEEFCELALSLKIKVGAGYYKVKTNKSKDLEMYAMHRNRILGI